MPTLIDIGVNLTHDSFDADRDGVIARAAAAGVTGMIVTGTTLAASREAIALANRLGDRIFATAGVHPHHASEYDASTTPTLRELQAEARCVAAGECGLDYFRMFSPREDQAAAFEAQLGLAAETGLPVFLHQRDAHGDFVAILREARPALAGGVAHCFTGGPSELEAYLELDLYIGVTGWVCDERRGQSLRDALPSIPLDRLLLETDAPYLLPRDLRPPPKSRRNEPAYLGHVLERVAQGLGLSPAETAAQTSANANRLFGLDRHEAAATSRAATAPSAGEQST